MSLFGLEGKKAVVIGGGRGMGEASALHLARAGCDVAIVDNEQARAQFVCEQVEKLGRLAMPVVADILDEEAVEAAVADIERRFGGIDVLVTIVGQALFKPILDMTVEEWDAEQNRNLRYVFVIAKAVARSMIARGQGGSIICIGSIDGVVGAPLHAAYGAAKAGLMHLVKSMAAEWGRDEIRVNAVAPGTITTPRLPETPESLAIVQRSVLPLGRPGTTDDIGGAVLFLASQLSNYVTGHILNVDGGWGAANLFDMRTLKVKQSNE